MEENLHCLRKGTRLIGRYTIEGVLGQGGFGITYLGIDELHEKKVAIKEFFPQGIVTRNIEYQDTVTVTFVGEKDNYEKGKERFLKEARTMAKFSKDEGIVKALDFFEINNTAYIVMEYLEGITLKQYLRENQIAGLPNTSTGTKLQKEVAAMEEAMKQHHIEEQCQLLIDEMMPQIKRLERSLSGTYHRNIIEYTTSRIKSPESIVEKLHRKNREVSLDKAVETLRDLAGIRVICSFQDDVYRVAGAIKNLPGYELVKEKNYINKPKASGYRSIHLILRPANTAYDINYIEIQVRSAAMNYWAILEYQLCYKNEKKGAERIRKELKECAIDIAKIDKKMLKLRKEIEKI